MKRFLGLFGALALMTGMLVAGAAPAGASPNFQVVWPGHSIQAAIDASGQGGTVVVLHGTYHEHLVITHGVKLIGLGATLAPPSAEQPGDACTGPDPADDGICIAGDFTVDPDTGAVTVNHYVEGVKITGFTITGFPGSGIDQIGGKGSTFVGNVARNNAEYGIAAFSSTGTTELFNTATGSAEAGFYIGDSPQANATLIANRSTNNLFGFFIRDAEHGTLAVNTATDNCVGALFLADAPGPDGAFSVVANNFSHNDKACPATEDGPPASGVGVFIFGAHDVSVHGNTILDNQPSGPSLASGGVVVATGLGGTPPQNNRVQGNLIKGNSTDIVWDGTGTGNVLKPNACVTSDPAGLCSAH
ncbi:MAG: right-handed parallel beta-helix repeat-containing protein [Acidimicrobiia bacterium]